MGGYPSYPQTLVVYTDSLHCIPVGMFIHPLILVMLLEKLFLENTVNIYSAQSIFPVGSEKTYLALLTSSCIKSPLPVIKITYESSSPGRKNGSHHVATRLNFSTVMLRLAGVLGSATKNKDSYLKVDA